MNKIPTLFVRDETNRKYVTLEVTPGLEWVLDGAEGTIATRKYDGTCVMFDGEKWWARREVKGNAATPDGYQQISYDPVTNKTMGYEPAENSGFAKFILEAVSPKVEYRAGTYELVGPRINGNPEGRDEHELIFHGEFIIENVPSDPAELQEYVRTLPFEGVVWWRWDKPVAKLKRKDLP